jgi:hypothetical protein
MTDNIKVEWGVPLPPLTRKKKGSKYTPYIEKFLEKNDVLTARISVRGAQSQAVASGLKTAVNALNVGDQVHVSNRGEAGVWLVKRTADNENASIPK